MKDTKKFDVLVVYSGTTASSAAKLTPSKTPFSGTLDGSSYAAAYEYFLENCEKQGLSAALSTTSDVSGAGKCNSYWLYENENWEKVVDACYSTNIFDKFSNKSKKLSRAQELCFSTKAVKPFNSRLLKKLFIDKLKTYQALPEFSIPTVALETETMATIRHSLLKLKELIAQHPHQEDFASTIIMKDRTGSQGDLIFKIEEPTAAKIQAILKKNQTSTFVLQPFVHFDKGFNYKEKSVATDIRLIYQNGEIIQTYIRMAKLNDFRCNQHQGGSLEYIDLSDLPTAVLTQSENVLATLGSRRSLFALDFIVANSGTVYLLEGNSNPGITWGIGHKKDEQMAKKLIRGIVKEFSHRTTQQVTPVMSVSLHPRTLPVGTNHQAPVLLP